MPVWLFRLGKGLALGFIGAGLNYFLLTRALKKIEKNPQENQEKIMLRCYSGRYVVNLATLVAAYFLFTTDVAALLGAALGLTVPKFIIYLKKFN